jgi:hypothetical protein
MGRREAGVSRDDLDVLTFYRDNASRLALGGDHGGRNEAFEILYAAKRRAFERLILDTPGVALGATDQARHELKHAANNQSKTSRSAGNGGNL